MDNKKIILITEDEVKLRSILRNKLEASGFTVFEAKNGEEGLEITERENPDLILVDIVMPKMDGIEMLKKLRENEKNNKIKFIILTNVDSTEKIAEAMRIAQTANDLSFEYFIKTDVKLEDIVKKISEKLLV
ncbi:MAG: response regulator [Candidatus Taylorbacteria bacterium]|nr:response regulator [Candidatus Taylorbacteria bacterium]